MKTKWILAICLAIGLVLIAGQQAVVAQSSSPTPVISDNEVNAIAKQLFCPV